jgi:hypothetical protein
MMSNPVTKLFRAFWAKFRWIAGESFKKAETYRKALRILGGEMVGSRWIDP